MFRQVAPPPLPLSPRYPPCRPQPRKEITLERITSTPAQDGHFPHLMRSGSSSEKRNLHPSQGRGGGMSGEPSTNNDFITPLSWVTRGGCGGFVTASQTHVNDPGRVWFKRGVVWTAGLVLVPVCWVLFTVEHLQRRENTLVPCDRHSSIIHPPRSATAALPHACSTTSRLSLPPLTASNAGVLVRLCACVCALAR